MGQKCMCHILIHIIHTILRFFSFQSVEQLVKYAKLIHHKISIYTVYITCLRWYQYVHHSQHNSICFCNTKTLNCLHFMYLSVTPSIGERCSKATVKESSIRSSFPSSWGMASKCSHSISSTPRISQQIQKLFLPINCIQVVLDCFHVHHLQLHTASHHINLV